MSESLADLASHPVEREWKAGPSPIRKLTGRPGNPRELAVMAQEYGSKVKVTIQTYEDGWDGV